MKRAFEHDDGIDEEELLGESEPEKSQCPDHPHPPPIS